MIFNLPKPDFFLETLDLLADVWRVVVDYLLPRLLFVLIVLPTLLVLTGPVS